MSQITCSRWMMNSAKTIPGRCKLFGIQYAYLDPDGNITRNGEPDLGKLSFFFHDGSVSGDVLFKYTVSMASSGYGGGISPYQLMFDGNWILFPSGMYVPALTGDSTAYPPPAKTQICVYYEGA